MTLTYAPEFLPQPFEYKGENYAAASVNPRHTQLFLKRLRKALHPRAIRFYLCGEYGETTYRPHYHAVLFGVSVTDVQAIATAWPSGHIHVGTLTLDSAQYCAGYVTKKMTSADDPRLEGRFPEFARMSLRPGIGADAMDDVAEVLTSEHGSKMLAQLDDVPTVLKHGSKTLPLGRYLRAKLREKLDIPERGMSSPACREAAAEMSSLFEAAQARSKAEKRAVIAQMVDGKLSSIEARYNVYRKKEKL